MLHVLNCVIKVNAKQNHRLSPNKRIENYGIEQTRRENL